MALMLSCTAPVVRVAPHRAAACARRAACAPHQALRRPCHHRAAVVVHAAKSSGGRPMGRNTSSSRGPEPEGPGYWTTLKDVSLKSFEAKQRVPVILANGLQLLVWRLEGELFCTAVNSTAFQYPLLDAEIVEPVPAGAEAPVVRVKLDGTTYQLRDGKVVEWCPKEDSPLSLRNMFAGLKSNSPPVPLPVYAVRANSAGAIEVFIPVAP